MSFNQEDPLPKPYDFVPISALARDDRRKPQRHDRYESGTMMGHLQGRLIAQTPLHVWSGQIEATGDSDVPLVKSLFKVNGQATVPGSSLKGAIRSIVEAITRSCVCNTKRWNRKKLPDWAAPCNNKKSLCTACRMFGAMGYQGNIRFFDAKLQPQFKPEIRYIPPLNSPGKSDDPYITGDKYTGRKFYQHGDPATGSVPIQACPVDSVLDFALQFDNLMPAELGLLLIALGQGDGEMVPRLWPKLGGGKPVCYGSVEIVLDRVDAEQLAEINRAHLVYASYDPVPKAATTDLTVYLQAGLKQAEEGQLQKLSQILKLDNERFCPSDNY